MATKKKNSKKAVAEIEVTSLEVTRAHEYEDIFDMVLNGAFADDPHGTRHFMGVFEFEGVYDRLITLGAKKYAAEENGELHITISGVNKKEGGKELAAAGDRPKRMHKG